MLAGTEGRVTVTVVVALFVIFPSVAVSVYVVVTDGATASDPVRATAPIPLSIVTPVAFRLVHESVETAGCVIVPGAAERVQSSGPQSWKVGDGAPATLSG